MQGLMAAIARALASVTTVWRWFGKTGRLVAVQVLGTLFGGSAAEAPVVEPVASARRTDYRLPDIAKTKKIKALAAAMDGKDVDHSLFIGVDDPVVNWLSAMTKEMRVKVRLASAIAIEDHMRGRHAIRGVLAFDRESVAEFNAIGGGGAGGRGKMKPLRQTAAAFGGMTK